jgi:TIM-barrel protein
VFEPRLALASLSGEADADWAEAGAEFAGAAFLGGVCLDAETRAAAREMVAERDRTEFLPDDPLAFLDAELSALADVPVRPAVNVRAVSPAPIAEAATVAAAHDAILEVNAHCRQDELCAAGCGESLLRETDRLYEYVSAAARTGVKGAAADAGVGVAAAPDVSVKLRAEVPGVDLVATCEAIEDAGASMVHLDAMDSESVVADVADATDLFVVANNGVRDRESVREYLDYGADAVSVGRPSDDPVVLERVRAAVDEWSQERQPTETGRGP